MDKLSIVNQPTEAAINDIIRMAWKDDVSFERIKRERGVSESEVIKIMRSNLKQGSFKAWRKRVSGRTSKHEKRVRIMNEAFV